MLLWLPVAETLPVPLPVTLRPAGPDRRRLPWATERSTLTGSEPASTSLTDGLVAPVKVSDASSSSDWGAGRLFAGASLFWATVTSRVSVLLSSPSASLTLIDTVRVAVDGVLLVLLNVTLWIAVW